VGVTSKRYIDALPTVYSVFKEIGLNIRYIGAIGDFEAFPQANRDRMKLTEEEFVQRLRESQLALRAVAPHRIETPLFTELCDGKETWMKYYESIYHRILEGDYGASGLDDEKLRTIALSRRQLYNRWYGEMESEEDYVRVMKAQSAEYATMGRIISTHFKDSLVLGADHARMAPFYNFDAPMPVLYLRNNYLGVR
ncbi:MAG: hypothetical protein O2912_01750, partial [Proteobacteria bacterium]|nr:hypothetical protein [Pseudomonadota bacterium]